MQHSNLIHRAYSLCYRVRPLNNKELKNGDQSVIQYPGNGQILVRSSFKFCFVFYYVIPIQYRLKYVGVAH
jgi:hypothetical protein